MKTDYYFDKDAFKVKHEGKDEIAIISNRDIARNRDGWGLEFEFGVPTGITKWQSEEQPPIEFCAKKILFSTIAGIGTQIDFPKEGDEVDIVKVYQDYVKLLGDELDELVVLASLHGWKSTRFDAGKQAREKIRMAEAGYQANKGKYNEDEVINHLAYVAENYNDFKDSPFTSAENYLQSLHPSPIGVRILTEKCDSCDPLMYIKGLTNCSKCNEEGETPKLINGIWQTEWIFKLNN